MSDTSNTQEAHIEFSGTPAKYKQIAVVGSFVLNTYLYLGMVGLVYGLNGNDWILGWKPILFTLVWSFLFSKIAFGWIMKLDAQVGSGKGWSLDSAPIKLPERRVRSK